MHLVIFCGFVLMQVCKAFLFLELQSTLHVEHCPEILWIKGNGRIGLRQHFFFLLSFKFCHFLRINGTKLQGALLSEYFDFV